MFNYDIDPHSIEKRSFALIRESADWSRFSVDEQQVAMRLVHTIGDPGIVPYIHFSSGALEAGQQSVQKKGTVICDVEMVKQGLTKRYLESETLCTLNDERSKMLASDRGETRSMAAVDLWQDHIENSVVLIGNAPTALFRLLEKLIAGWPKPSLIIGMPVGFVGAAESKDALIKTAESLDLNFMTIKGRHGGSALTASAYNALLRLNRGIRF